MDAFFAAVEQKDDPSLRGRPVIVGGLGKRGVVATCSYEARVFGVHSAQPTAVARRLCPRGVFLPPRMRRYAEISARIRRVFEDFSPLVEPLSLDEAFLDLSGTERLFGPPQRAALALQEAVEEAVGLPLSIGAATSKFVAKVASDLRKPRGLVLVPPGSERSFLAPLPLSRLWGAGEATRTRMEELGLRRIGDLQDLGLEACVRHLGEVWGRRFHELSLGRDPRKVSPGRKAKSIGHETTFPENLAGREAQLAVLCRLCERVGRRLRKQGFTCGLLRLKLRFPPFVTRSRQIRLPEPLDEDRRLFDAAKRLFLEACPEPRPLRLLGVTAADLRSKETGRQASLFTRRRDEAGNRLSEALDRIRDRFGEDSISLGRTGRIEDLSEEEEPDGAVPPPA